ncbi:MAG: lipoyl(octanoyl) transferase LipB [Fimbriimonadaceae bacterium]|nr:lipoyl(octanoyl) transferase LipB [Fimbriimonadaceae bacterium]QYK58548.1 MAG: lipoyl(octanoyl) transferase LipB [Fimbriimonadaceae bacterium]
MKIVDLGRMEYRAAWEAQIQAHAEVAGGGEDTLILVEHPPVLTLGASFHEENLLLSMDQYQEHGIQVVRTDRGGDVTYHGPGQLVIYPVFDVARHGRDLHHWLRQLEETVIAALRSFGLSGQRHPPHTGVWIDAEGELKKVAAIGIKVKRWVSLHGIAVNCDNDLGPFSLIVPCGIHDHGVTSISEALRISIRPDEAKAPFVQAFRETFPTP